MIEVTYSDIPNYVQEEVSKGAVYLYKELLLENVIQGACVLTNKELSTQLNLPICIIESYLEELSKHNFIKIKTDPLTSIRIIGVDYKVVERVKSRIIKRRK